MAFQTSYDLNDPGQLAAAEQRYRDTLARDIAHKNQNATFKNGEIIRHVEIGQGKNKEKISAGFRPQSPFVRDHETGEMRFIQQIANDAYTYDPAEGYRHAKNTARLSKQEGFDPMKQYIDKSTQTGYELISKMAERYHKTS